MTSAGTENPLLTIDEAAAIVRTPVGTLRYWRYLGTGPRSFKLGRRVFYRQADVEEWLNVQAGDERKRA